MATSKNLQAAMKELKAAKDELARSEAVFANIHWQDVRAKNEAKADVELAKNQLESAQKAVVALGGKVPSATEPPIVKIRRIYQPAPSHPPKSGEETKRVQTRIAIAKAGASSPKVPKHDAALAEIRKTLSK